MKYNEKLTLLKSATGKTKTTKSLPSYFLMIAFMFVKDRSVIPHPEAALYASTT